MRMRSRSDRKTSLIQIAAGGLTVFQSYRKVTL